MKSTLFKTVLFVLAAVFTFGFSANKSFAAQSTIKVGVVYSMTGASCFFWTKRLGWLAGSQRNYANCSG